MKPKFAIIQLEKIRGERLYPIRFDRDDKQLKSSLENNGILFPLHLVTDGENLLILDGWARFHILREMGGFEVPCFIHEQMSMSAGDSFLLYLDINRWNRRFNLVEKALCLNVAETLFQTIPLSFWEMTEMKKDMQTIHQYRDMLKLPLVVKHHAVNHQLPISVVLDFLKFPEDEIEKIASLLFVLPLNHNKLGEVLGLLFDISRREQISAVKILENGLSQLKSGTEPNGRAEKLRQILQDRRNPEYHSHLCAFQAKVKKLTANKKIKILPAPFFTDDSVEIKAKIHSRGDLKDLENLLEDKSWQSLLKS